jgi:hypothetical protein
MDDLEGLDFNINIDDNKTHNEQTPMREGWQTS